MAERPSARIQVMGPYDRKKKADFFCRLDHHIRLDHNRIQATFPELLTDIDLDLLTMVAAAGYADRVVRRHRGRGWGRDLEIHVPVWDLTFWARPALRNALTRTLGLLTGDAWTVRFTKLQRRRELQTALRADRTPFSDLACVIPFSGGLDSVAGLRLWQRENPRRSALQIGTETNHFVGDIIRRTSTGQESRKRVSVRLQMAPGDHPEPTNRTRTFVFFATAALAAKLAGVRRVVVMENGQGALGPSLVPTGDEWPYRSTHPAFTSSLHRFLQLLWGPRTPTFDHPHLWQTKAEVLRLAADGDGSPFWGDTHSCSRNLRRTKQVGAPSCGVCGGCLLRRCALAAAGVRARQGAETFVWHNLRAASLSASGSVAVTEHDENIAMTNVLNMRFMAELASSGSDPALLRVAAEVADAEGIGQDTAVGRLRRLVNQHRSEWIAFVDRLGSQSWVTQLGRPTR